MGKCKSIKYEDKHALSLIFFLSTKKENKHPESMRKLRIKDFYERLSWVFSFSINNPQKNWF